ncbi:hypothetical protein KDD30_09995 [Photobacterium sp. GJ3]|uniref:DUF6916 family protein n=1 Tax=Photobacterium sp. GJ3 TaxID=2829502 RepID=UPI001B8BFBA7|nr:hypothetical protein [Photobacterium sp. GJ3]QUJ66498.1 hypothetical protein KDD30_09995 [Photobacterium sp. GJ3]
MEQFTFERLEKMVGEKLTVALDNNQTVEVEISDVQRTATHGKLWEAFALYLDCGELEGGLAQGTYPFSHEKLGEVALFVSPNSASELEVIFSRRVEQP